MFFIGHSRTKAATSLPKLEAYCDIASSMLGFVMFSFNYAMQPLQQTTRVADRLLERDLDMT